MKLDEPAGVFYEQRYRRLQRSGHAELTNPETGGCDGLSLCRPNYTFRCRRIENCRFATTWHSYLSTRSGGNNSRRCRRLGNPGLFASLGKRKRGGAQIDEPDSKGARLA